MGVMTPPSRKSCYNFRVVSIDKVLDGEPTYCPTTLPDIKPKPKISRQEVKGEVDIYNPYHWNKLHGVFVENLRRKRIEENMTPPSDAINSALDDFMEAQYGSDGSTEQEKLL